MIAAFALVAAEVYFSLRGARRFGALTLRFVAVGAAARRRVCVGIRDNDVAEGAEKEPDVSALGAAGRVARRRRPRRRHR